MPKPDQYVNVTVVGGQTKVDQSDVGVSIQEKNQVIWRTNQNETFVVVFKNESPFDEDVLIGTKADPICSGGTRIKVIGQEFHYKVKVHRAETLDPVVHTDP